MGSKNSRSSLWIGGLMLNENAKKWVAALKSGGYKQGTGNLQRNGEFCCLGVACAIAIDNGMKLEIEKIDEGDEGWYVRYDGQGGALPFSVVKWLNLVSSIGEIKSGSSLIRLNDTGKTFAEIADIIESEPEGLFV